jgi:flagellar biosynthesis/type III secretory pathway protein FliH
MFQDKEFKKEIDEIKGMIEKMMDHGDKKKEEMSSQIVEEVSLAVTEVLNEEEKIKEELSAPAVEPMKHNPEVEAPKINVRFANRRAESTLDRVMNNIAKINNK